MFTGIIIATGIIQIIQNQSTQWLINTALPIALGESMSVNGICLTAKKLEKDGFWADLSPETLQKTTAQYAKPEQIVNLEPALKLEQRLGGHWVSGHVDDIGTIQSINSQKEFSEWKFKLPKHLMRYVVQKGSIAIDGISLTVNNIKNNIISCMIVPHTQQNTNLANKKTGDLVNIEADIIAKHIEKLQTPYPHE